MNATHRLIGYRDAGNRWLRPRFTHRGIRGADAQSRRVAYNYPLQDCLGPHTDNIAVHHTHPRHRLD